MPALLSVPIFFIIFRETVEAGIIVSVLLSFVEQLMTTGHLAGTSATLSKLSVGRHSLDSEDGSTERAPSRDSTESAALLADPSSSAARLSGDSDSDTTARPVERVDMSEDERDQVAILVRRMKTQIWAGTLAGLALATAIGAAFIVVFYVKLVDLWASTEQLWEGAFSLLAAALILVMGIAFLRMDRARVKWRYKLSMAFERSHRRLLRARAVQAGERVDVDPAQEEEDEKEGQGGKWALFLLPFVTVLREGLEAVLFVSGVALSVEPSAIPLATLAGLILGIFVGLAIYRTGSTTTLHYFLIASTSLLFLIGAGLASKGVGFLQYYAFASAVGGDVAETGDGPGSFKVEGNVWHFECCNPEPGSQSTNGFWQLANSLVGWNNTATEGSVGAYIAYWLVVAAVLVRLKWKEGRMSLFGRTSGRRIALRTASGQGHAGSAVETR